ncbi:OTU family cysteine protease [Cyclospora cayetanensis]|uniref:Ubiquitin thioesterase OTU n=1 Tax=Cyclospora cayetanensis TaxID=88456 RepID=A0A1D3CU47_9EIME|nr:OTU family cysteine protease [Cyclospora cayetanensis]
MDLAIRFNGERHLLRLPAGATVEELQHHVQQATQLHPQQQLLRWGFPPKSIPTEQGQRPLSDLGCSNGQLILVETTKPNAIGSLNNGRVGGNSTSSGSCASSKAVSPEAPTSAPAAPALRDFGIQQQQTEPPSASCELPAGVSGALLECLEASAAAVASAPRPAVSPYPPGGYTFVRLPVPADDSCLFASIAVVAVPSVSSQQLRDVAALGILKNPDTFSEVVLEMQPQDYVSRLRNSRTWGGYVELAVLAEQLRQQIAVVDAETCRLDLYGEKYTTRRSYLLYDGIHYDPLVVVASQGRDGTSGALQRPSQSSPADMLTVFSPEDAAAAAAASAVGHVVQQQQGYVRAGGMLARCLVCGELSKDNEAMRAHAKATGHQNFAHIQQ